MLRKCGDPFNVETRDEERFRFDTYTNVPDDGRTYFRPPLVREYVRVEEWEYNFGPTRFLYYLSFENSVLTRIVAGDYGY